MTRQVVPASCFSVCLSALTFSLKARSDLSLTSPDSAGGPAAKLISGSECEGGQHINAALLGLGPWPNQAHSLMGWTRTRGSFAAQGQVDGGTDPRSMSEWMKSLEGDRSLKVLIRIFYFIFFYFVLYFVSSLYVEKV